ncbi:S-locus glycoprotein [Corchorus olitorius]|uniref:S-locus glycoprotein n=1 Tax=Corchorus olitorius TaxID=93759 RepID=A0A1R3K1N9_9ROSI|nr:S-locus glycoprotein [Corchorus olitorius]
MDILSLATCFLIIFSKASNAVDMISPFDSLADGMTLVSNDGSFEMGFFTPGSSKNRMNPITDSTGLLKIETTGKVVLQGQNRTTVWAINSTEGVPNPILQLLDSGNLVVRDGKDGNSENYLWQSFDYPTDTMLPGMKIGWDLKTGLSRRLAAWKNADDPSPGDLTYGVELQGNPELVIRKGSVKFVRSGLWNGDGFSGTPNYRNNPVFAFDFVWNEDEVYYINFLKNKSVMARVVLDQTEGKRQRYAWNPETQTWKLFSVIPNDYCDTYGLCGPNGNWTGSGCAMWFGDLMDIKQGDSYGQDLYIRVSASESEELNNKHKLKLALIIATPLAVLLGLLIVLYYIRRSWGKFKDNGEEGKMNDTENEDQNEDLELEVFELGTISRATDGFSSNNKLGQGGFGPVYKAWKLWKEGRPLELADDFLTETGNLSEVVRCIHISLLCVQQHPEGRPNMSSVVVMLGSENELPLPKQPGFLLHKSPFETDSSSGNYGSTSKNEVSLSLLEPR